MEQVSAGNQLKFGSNLSSIKKPDACLPVQNRILARILPAAFERLRPHLSRVQVAKHAILQDYNWPIEYVHFIERGVASTLTRTSRDGPIEVSLTGRFGFVGVAIVLGESRSPQRCVMHMDGETMRIPAQVFARLLDEDQSLQRQMLRFVHVVTVQHARRTLCNARHDIQERLAGWLLLAGDELASTQIPVTHERLSMILAVRRAGVTEALADLEHKGAVRRQRGTLQVIDRKILEHQACECYRLMAGEFRGWLNTHQATETAIACHPTASALAQTHSAFPWRS